MVIYKKINKEEEVNEVLRGVEEGDDVGVTCVGLSTPDVRWQDGPSGIHE